MKKQFIIILTFMLIFCNACEGNAADNNAQSIQCGDVITETLSKQKNSFTYVFEPSKTDCYDFIFVNPPFKTDDITLFGIDGYYYEKSEEDGSFDEHPDYGQYDSKSKNYVLSTTIKKGERYYIIVEVDRKKIKEEMQAQFQLKKHTHSFSMECYTRNKNNYISYYCELCGISKLGKVNMNLSKATFVYNGKKQQPKVTVKNTQNPQLTKKDYKVSMPNSKKVGTYTVMVTYKNQYKDLKKQKKTYKIVPKGTDIKSLQAKKKGITVKWNKQTTQTSGYQIQYATNAKMKKAKTINVASNKMTKKTVSRLSKKKTYYVRIRTYKKIKDTKYVSSWSSVASVTTK